LAYFGLSEIVVRFLLLTPAMSMSDAGSSDSVLIVPLYPWPVNEISASAPVFARLKTLRVIV